MTGGLTSNSEFKNQVGGLSAIPTPSGNIASSNSEISMQLNILNVILDALDKSVLILQDRINPILSGSKPINHKDQVAEPMMSAELAKLLQIYNTRILTLTSQINDLTSRVEL